MEITSNTRNGFRGIYSYDLISTFSSKNKSPHVLEGFDDFVEEITKLYVYILWTNCSKRPQR
jgi:hypothetical protein